MRSRLAVVLTALALLVLPALAQEALRSPTPTAVKLAATVTDVARGLDHPWGVELLPDGRFLVTERPGRLRIVSAGGQLSEPLTGVPEVYARGQGGLLDVALSPGFAQDQLVYLSFSEPGQGGAGTAVARGRLGARGLEGTQVIWRQQPKVEGPNHWGSRLVFRADGTLFVTLGDRYAQRERAQDLSTTIGKIVRINADGSAPRDNPFVGRAGALPEIWSLRPPQCPGGGPRRARRAVDGRARRARRRRAQQSAAGEELRLAGHHLRRGLLGRAHRDRHREGGHGAARRTTGIR